jgi:hypothetical protein
VGIGLLVGSIEAGPNLLIRKRPEMGTLKNKQKMPENSINVPINGFMILFPPFL